MEWIFFCKKRKVWKKNPKIKKCTESHSFFQSQKNTSSVSKIKDLRAILYKYVLWTRHTNVRQDFISKWSECSSCVFHYLIIPITNLPLWNHLRIITSLLITQDTRKLKTLNLRLNIHGVTNWNNSRHEVDLMISPVFIHLSLLCPVIWHSDLKRTESGQASAVVKNCVGQDSQT